MTVDSGSDTMCDDFGGEWEGFDESEVVAIEVGNGAALKAISMGKPWHEVEELAQEAQVKALIKVRKGETISDPNSFGARCASNSIIDGVRREQVHNRHAPTYFHSMKMGVVSPSDEYATVLLRATLEMIQEVADGTREHEDGATVLTAAECRALWALYDGEATSFRAALEFAGIVSGKARTASRKRIEEALREAGLWEPLFSGKVSRGTMGRRDAHA